MKRFITILLCFIFAIAPTAIYAQDKPISWPAITINLTAEEHNNIRVLLDVAQKAAGTQVTLPVAVLISKLDAATKQAQTPPEADK